MRTVVLTVIAAAALAGAAQAQAPAAPAAAAPAPAAVPGVAPAAPAPATAAAAAAAAPPAAAAAPVNPAPAPAAVAAPAPPAAPPPALPTTGDGAAVISLLERVCTPMVRGGDLAQLAKSAGMKFNRRDESWSMAMGPKPYSLTVLYPGSNKDVCQVEVHYAVGQDQPIVSAVNVWSFLHQPELILQANYVNVGPDGVKRVRKSWEHLDSARSIAVNFTSERTAADQPPGRGYDVGRLFYQERPVQ